MHLGLADRELHREALLFHTGARGLFPLVSEAIAKVLPLASIRYVAFSHFEADEGDILGPSEAFRAPMDYYAHAPQTAAVLERLARGWGGVAAGAGEEPEREGVGGCGVIYAK